MSLIPAFLICTKHTAKDEWRPELVDVDMHDAIDRAKDYALRGAYCACVMQVGGVDAVPMFTFTFATKGRS